MNNNLAHTISEILNIDEKEVKKTIPLMSLEDIMGIIDAIKDNDKEQVFKIYSGYGVWK